MVDVTKISAEAWEASKFRATVSKVTIAGAPVVEFSVSDANGAAVIGLDKVTSKSSTATVASYPNVSFALAKLMPRTDAAPS